MVLEIGDFCNRDLDFLAKLGNVNVTVINYPSRVLLAETDRCPHDRWDTEQ